MPHLQRSIDIDAEPERVFSHLVAWDGLTGWSTITVGHTGPARCSSIGETFRQTIRVAGLHLRTDWEVTEHEPPAVIAYRVRGPVGARLVMRQQVTGTSAASRVAFDIKYDLPGGALGEAVGRLYARRSIRRETDRTLANLKDALETGS